MYYYDYYAASIRSIIGSGKTIELHRRRFLPPKVELERLAALVEIPDLWHSFRPVWMDIIL